MVNRAVLNNVEHADLRVVTQRAAAFGDQVNQTLIFPTEIGEAQRDYPILFRRDTAQERQAVVLLGLDRDENLYLDADGGWNAQYVPAVHERGPFSIGLKKDNSAADAGVDDAMIQVDLDDPRVGVDDGEALFLPHGGYAPYLEHVMRVLQRIHLGVELNKKMFAAFEAADLIEPVSVEITLSDREQYSLPGFETISTERLAKLDGSALQILNSAGFLNLAFLIASSLGNVQRLIEMKNRLRGNQQKHLSV